MELILSIIPLLAKTFESMGCPGQKRIGQNWGRSGMCIGLKACREKNSDIQVIGYFHTDLDILEEARRIEPEIKRRVEHEKSVFTGG